MSKCYTGKQRARCNKRTVSTVLATDKPPKPLAGNKIYTHFPSFILNQNACDVQCL